jgi:Zn-finger nucleic acid-binding protein
MKCPRCEGIVLEEIDRSGITVDRCGSCRGIWLDRGELEKLLARATAEVDVGTPASAQPRGPARYHDHDRDPPSSDRGRDGHRRRRSFWHERFD